MKLLFERDIPEFKNKTWRERSDLRRQAENLDWRIRIRSLIIGPATFALVFTSLMLLEQRHILRSLMSLVVLYIAIGFPLDMFLRALWINPLIKHALENSKGHADMNLTAR